jgi:hypothetical protein
MNNLKSLIKKAWDWFDWGGKQAQKISDEIYLKRTELSESDRKKILDQLILTQVGRGATEVTRSDYQVVLSYGGKANHVLHFILSLLTFGLWLFVWLFIAWGNKPKRYTYTVDKFGAVSSS